MSVVLVAIGAYAAAVSVMVIALVFWQWPTFRPTPLSCLNWYITIGFCGQGM